MRKLNILVSPDKFKYSLSAKRICQVVEATLPASKYTIKSVPLADGGEGSLVAIEPNLQVERVEMTVNDPLFRPVRTHYLFDRISRTSYI